MRPEIVQTYPFISKWRAKGYQYYVVPKDMLTEGAGIGVNLDETFLYVVLRDRTKLSHRNNWVDDNGHIYIIYTREEAAKYIGWSLRKTIDVFARLVESGLLKEVEQPNRQSVLKKPKRLFLQRWVPPSLLSEPAFQPYTGSNIYADSDPYYIIPKVFFEEEALRGLSLRAIMLYAIALDKLHLSINYGRVDDAGRVWCSLDRDAVRRELGCSQNSLTSAYRELEDIGLIVRKMAPDSHSYRIYLRDYLPDGEGAENGASQNLHMENGANAQGLHMETSNPAHGERSICTWGAQSLHMDSENAAPGRAQNLHPSQSRIHLDGNHLSGDSIGARRAPDAPEKEKRYWDFSTAYEAWQDKLDYPRLCADIARSVPSPAAQDTMFRLLDMSIDLLAKDEVFPGKYIRMGQEVVDKQTVVRSHRRIDAYVLYTLLNNVKDRVGEIENLEAYLHRALLRAADDHEGAAYYTKRDLGY